MQGSKAWKSLECLDIEFVERARFKMFESPSAGARPAFIVCMITTAREHRHRQSRVWPGSFSARAPRSFGFSHGAAPRGCTYHFSRDAHAAIA